MTNLLRDLWEGSPPPTLSDENIAELLRDMGDAAANGDLSPEALVQLGELAVEAAKRFSKKMAR